MSSDFPKDTEPSELLQKFHQRALPTTDERVSMHQQIVARWKDSSLSTIPSKDLLKSEIYESDLSNVLWVGSHFNQPFLYEEDVLSSKRIDSERTLWLYDPKRCWVDVLVRRVYLGGAYNRRHCKSDHELIALCPKKAFGVALQMHFNEKSDDVDRFALLKRLHKAIAERSSMLGANLLGGRAGFFALGNSVSTSKTKENSIERSFTVRFSFSSFQTRM